MRKLLAFMLMFVFAVALVGCGEKKPTIEITGGTSVEAGKTLQLTATVKNAKSTEVKWSSVKASVASVSNTGLVTGVSSGSTVIKATLVEDETVSAQVAIRVSGGTINDYPDLGGYTIKIAQAGHAINETDPFHEEYKGLDKEAKQQAWNFVEEKFNVKIEVVAYPDDAEWGAPRWQYIEQQAAAGKADYDFYTVPDSQIGRFVEANAILDTTEWYAKYGKGFLDEVYKQAGSYKNKIYTITNGTSGIYNVMYYNIGLLEKLNLGKSPAQLFNDGEWTYSKFQEYAIAAQAKLNELATPETPYYAVAGNSPYYWIGMANAGGVKLADVSTYQINIKDPIAVTAAGILRAIKEAGAMDPAKQVDAGVTSWMDGRALFASGDLWFVKTSNRWKEDLWGAGETKFGYVPFPRPDDMAKEDQKIGLGGTATWVMPVARDYSGYTSDVSAENIYYAMVTAFLKTQEFQVSSPTYDEDVLRRTNAEKYADAEDSIQAFMWMSENIEKNGFYDPLSIPDNPIVNTGYGDFSTAVNNYVMGTAPTFSDAVDSFISVLQEKLYKAFS